MRLLLRAASLAAALALASAADAREGPHRIGFVSPIASGPTIAAFREGLTQAGLAEGKDYVLEARFAEGHLDRLPRLVSEVLGEGAEVLVVGSEPGTLAAMKATSSVPIVFAGLINPVPNIVKDLARPGGNVTGVTFGVGDVGFGGKYVELLKELLPSMSHVAALANLNDFETPRMLDDIRKAAGALRVKVTVVEVKRPEDLDAAFEAVSASHAQGLIIPISALFAANREALARKAAARRIPTIYFMKMFADAGGLISYGSRVEESYRRAAGYVAKILNGSKPGELPVEQPTRVELVVNLRAARALKLPVPRSLVDRADEVID